MNKLLNHGIVEVATLIPNEVKIANPKFNVDEILLMSFSSSFALM